MSISVQLGKISNFPPTSFLAGGNTKKSEGRERARAGIATYTTIILSSPQYNLFPVLFQANHYSEILY